MTTDWTKAELLDHLMLHLFEAESAASKLEAMGYIAGSQALACLLRDARNEWRRETGSA